MRKNWSVRDAIPEPAEEDLREYPALLRRLLYHRGLNTREAASRFLNPDYERDLSDPFLMSGMDRAVARLAKAVRDGEGVVVFADYDADGVPGAALLADFFRLLRFPNFEVYLPDRHTEPYGLSLEAVRKFAAAGSKLLITVDCGISDVAEVALARELGLEVIVTDHHLPPAVLPEALAVLNPKQPGDRYPDKMLCGAGVAFKLVQGLIRRGGFSLPAGVEKWLLDLVALATIADMVPLRDENRALAYFGLKVLRKTRRLGLLRLFDSLRLTPQFITEEDVGFSLGPRINAAGRMSHASEAYFLLSTQDHAEAETIIRHLEAKNAERQRAVARVVNEVEAALSQEPPPLIVKGSKNWSPAVLGLAATRLVERYHRPVCLWGQSEETAVKGSCRSNGLTNLVNLMAEAGGTEFFQQFGGHAAAAGFRLAPDRLAGFEDRLLTAFEAVEKVSLPPELILDGLLSIDDVNEETYRLVEALAPYGQGNPKPIFLFPGLSIGEARTFGNGGIHLELSFSNLKSEVVKAVGFFAGGQSFSGAILRPGGRVDLAAAMERNHFRGDNGLRLRLCNLRPAGG